MMGCFWLIEQRHVVRMRVPFPNVDSTLAVQPHMYICIKNGAQKEFIKCQTFKPTHLLKNKRPFKYIIESPDINRNPFKDKTTIDCDKSFYINNVIVDRSLLTTRRIDVCEELFNSIILEINHQNFSKSSIDIEPLLSLNTKITIRS